MAQNVKKGLYSLLTGESTIRAFIGPRMYPIKLPESCPMPALRYSYAGGNSEPTFETSGLQRVRIQFDCFGSTADDAEDLRTALTAFLNGYSGTLVDGTRLQLAQHIQPIDFYESVPRQFRCAAEFYLTFNFNF